MARSRNIKPGFFTNEDLVELDFATRLLFAGLWTVADKEGRLEDRPKKIKIDIFPADSVDVDTMLQSLHDRGFIVRYTLSTGKFIQIETWAKHQNPHHTEKASVIPDKNGELTVKAPLKPVDSPKLDGGNPADSLLLIPDSLVIDSLPKSVGSAKRRTQLPPDFYPNETGLNAAEAKRLTAAVEITRFRDFHDSKGSVMLDWQAAWRTWVSNARPVHDGQPAETPYARQQREKWETVTGRNRQNTNAILENAI